MSVFRKLSQVVPGRSGSKSEGDSSPVTGPTGPRRSIATIFHRGEKDYISSTDSETDSDYDMSTEGMSKKAAKRQLQKQKKKEAKSRLSIESGRDDSEERAHQRLEDAKVHETDEMRARYGDLPIMQSTINHGEQEKRIHIDTITEDMIGQEVLFRCRLHHTRNMGQKLMFLVFRQQVTTIQGVLHEEAGVVSPLMIHWAEHLRTGSVMRVRGKVQKPGFPIKSATVHNIEIHVTELKIIMKREDPSMSPHVLHLRRTLIKS